MTLFKLKATSCILIENDIDNNVLPFIAELVENSGRKDAIRILCYEQPVSVWQTTFTANSVQCFKESQLLDFFSSPADKSIYIIDSVNQMILDTGWNDCIKYLKTLLTYPDISKLIIILHRDCLINSKIHIQLSYLANAIVSYEKKYPHTLNIQIKKGGKLFKSEEIISYNVTTSSVKLTPVIKEVVSTGEPQKVLPNELSTFKIEVDQVQQLEKNKLKLPYMSKIEEGKGKVYYEPDAIDDWDDEDPDDDLDI